MAASPDSEVRVCDRYEIHAPIARGGMATVRLGRLRGVAGFSRVVAIKELHPHLASDPEFVAMLLDEARLASRIRHPNVVTVLDLISQDESVLLVMEYIHGVSLRRLLRRARKGEVGLEPAVAVAIVVDALCGLEAAHSATSEEGEPLGIVHRDVSPHNLLVGADGVTRVLDFGIAKAAARSQTTREGMLKGKLSYMAPELLRGSVATPRADVYAAGVVLWEALTSRELFRANSEAELLGRVLEGVVVPPSRVRPGLPAELDEVVTRALSRQPEPRFESAAAMASALSAAFTPAPKIDVARRVDQLAGSALEKQQQRVNRVERGPGVVEDESTAGLDGPGPTRTAVPQEAAATPAETIRIDTSDSERPLRSRAVLGLGAAAALLIGGALALGVSHAPPPGRLATGGFGNAHRAFGTTTRVLQAAVHESPVRPPVLPPSPPAPTESASRPGPAWRPAAPNCNPPVAPDASGILRVKPGCAKPPNTP